MRAGVLPGDPEDNSSLSLFLSLLSEVEEEIADRHSNLALVLSWAQALKFLFFGQKHLKTVFSTVDQHRMITIFGHLSSAQTDVNC